MQLLPNHCCSAEAMLGCWLWGKLGRGAQHDMGPLLCQGRAMAVAMLTRLRLS